MIGYCLITGLIKDVSGTVMPGQAVFVREHSTEDGVTSNLTVSTSTNVDGVFSMILKRNTVVTLVIEAMKINRTLRVPDLSSVSLEDWIKDYGVV